MKTLHVNNLSLYFSERKILDDISFSMDEKTRASLTGDNGSGKSTLLKAISGKIEPDSLNISVTKGSRISYLPQQEIVFPHESVYSAAEKAYDRFLPLLARLDEIEDSSSMKKAEEISQIHEELEEGGYYGREKTLTQILLGLGFKKEDFDRTCSTFSGGWQMRIALAKILAEAPDFLFLDEPTNYLDIEAITWLSGFLSHYKGGVMLVSHDRDFLDENVKTTYEIKSGKLKEYKGNYSYYLLKKEEDEAFIEKQREKLEKQREKTEAFIERFRYKATKAKQVQSRIKSLEKMEEIESETDRKSMKFSFPVALRSGNDVIIAEHLCKSYGSNQIYKDFSFIVNRGERLAITGRNGSGKSTLIRMLAGSDTAFSGIVRYGSNVKACYYAQDSENTLNDANSVLEEVESVTDTADLPKVRSLLGSFLFTGDDVLKKCSILSGGEKARVALCKMLMHPTNLLLLDEATNHLDIKSKEVLLEAIKSYEGTVVFVSHDKHFISNLATRILYLSEEGPEFFQGDYDYFNYKLKQKEEKFLTFERKEEKTEKKEVKATRRDENQARNRKKSLVRSMEILESEISSLEEEIEMLKKESEREEIYSDYAKITEVLEKKKEKEMLKEEKENSWLELCEEKEELEKD